MSTPHNDPTLLRLDDQIVWYDRRSAYNQRAFKLLKFLEIAAAAIIPFSAGFELTPWVTGALAIVVVVTEGVQQLNQYHSNWLSYRSTCESLKHEKYLYLAKAGPYASSNDPHALLAEHIEELVSREHAKWLSAREAAAKAKGT